MICSLDEDTQANIRYIEVRGGRSRTSCKFRFTHWFYNDLNFPFTIRYTVNYLDKHIPLYYVKVRGSFTLSHKSVVSYIPGEKDANCMYVCM